MRPVSSWAFTSVASAKEMSAYGCVSVGCPNKPVVDEGERWSDDFGWSNRSTSPLSSTEAGIWLA